MSETCKLLIMKALKRNESFEIWSLRTTRWMERLTGFCLTFDSENGQHNFITGTKGTLFNNDKKKKTLKYGKRSTENVIRTIPVAKYQLFLLG